MARQFGAYLINVGLGNIGLNMPIESALVILVPEAEVLVESFRLQHDPSAALTLLDNESGRWQVRRRFSLDTDEGTRKLALDCSPLTLFAGRQPFN